MPMQVWPEGLSGIEIKVEGFSHRLAALTETIVQTLVTLKVPPVMLPLLHLLSMT